MNNHRITNAALDCISKFNTSYYPLENIAKEVSTKANLNSKERKELFNLVFLWAREVFLANYYFEVKERFFSSLSYNQKQKIILEFLFNINPDYHSWKESLGDKAYSLKVGIDLYKLLKEDYPLNVNEIIDGLFLPSCIYLAIDENFINIKDVTDILEKNNIFYELSKLIPNAVKLNNRISLNIFSQLQEHIWIMDLGSQIIANLIKPSFDEKVLDFCAGKGIKSRYIKKYTDNLVLLELNKKRIEHAKEWLNDKNILFLQQDATLEIKNLPYESFEWILLDAPCSGIGTIRRHPDILHRWQKNFKLSVELQYKLLKNAVKYLKPGGKLIYSTCSLLKKENHEQINKVLKEEKNIEIANIFIKDIKPDDFGYILFPHIYNTDGFFICCLTKNL